MGIQSFADEGWGCNAVALPGGRIYLYDGLIKLTDGNPNQLAASSAM